MRFFHCTCALILLLAGPAAAQQASPAPAATGYMVFLRGTPVGREDVTVRSDANGTTVTTQGRLSEPLNFTLRRAEFKYRPDWQPETFALEATANGSEVTLKTSFNDATATTEGTQGGKPITTSHKVARLTIAHANGVFGSYAALARRLLDATPGAEYRIYVIPQAEITVRVQTLASEQMQVGTTLLRVRRYELAFVNPGGELTANLTATEDGSLVRLSIPAQALDVVRADVASSTSRTQIYSNPGDEPVVIPAPGFNIGATLTRPKNGPARLPAVVLLTGSGIGDRDGFALGIPTLAQLAGALADAGVLAVRYDKRGYGQSGGRIESATLSDYADDARTVVRWLSERKDVDPKRIAVVGHSEGAWVGLLAAAREKRIAAVVSIAGPAARGAELVLEQQQHALDLLDLAPAERESRVALQKQIQTAVLTGKGWEGVPADLRRVADTPWFQSVLAYDPAKVIKDVRQPLLFVHGEIDKQVPVEHAERLADLARKDSDSKSVELIVVRGVNHLMVPAVTGEVSEYGSLSDRNISKDVTMAVTGWLTKTFAAIKN